MLCILDYAREDYELCLQKKITISFRGGYYIVCQQVVEFKLWGLPYAHLDYALLAMENGLGSSHPVLYSSNNCDSSGDNYNNNSNLLDVGSNTVGQYSDRISKKVRSKLYYIDNLRVLACFLAFQTYSTMTATDPYREVWKFRDGETVALLANLQIGSALLVSFLYTVMQNIKFKESLQRIVTNIAKFSFCIYLTHIYIARELYWGIFNGSSIHIFPRTFLIALLTLLTGYLLTWLLNFLPKSKYITGA